MANNTAGKYLKADCPATKLLSAKERAKDLVLAEVQIASDQTWRHFRFYKQWTKSLDDRMTAVEAGGHRW